MADHGARSGEAVPQPKGEVLAVGGIGGSGTRIVAEIAGRLGVDMGGDLNESSDNLSFTFLMRRPAWYQREVQAGGGDIALALELFEQAMTGRRDRTPAQLSLIDAAANDMRNEGLDPRWISERVAWLLAPGTSRLPDAGWGWKEPNTHIYLDYLHRSFRGRLRYIHVMRHGLDMAWSSNQWQLHSWGSLFGVRGDGIRPGPAAALDYWIAANERALSLGRSLFDENFLVVSFDHLCADPANEVEKLADFLDVRPDPASLAACVALPRPALSAGRWRRAGLDPFTREQLVKVAQMGFPIDR